MREWAGPAPGLAGNSRLRSRWMGDARLVNRSSNAIQAPRFAPDNNGSALLFWATVSHWSK